MCSLRIFLKLIPPSGVEVFRQEPREKAALRHKFDFVIQHLGPPWIQCRDVAGNSLGRDNRLSYCSKVSMILKVLARFVYAAGALSNPEIIHQRLWGDCAAPVMVAMAS